MDQSVSSNNPPGFTLIEFCVAVLIMMVGLLGLLQAVNIATEQNMATLTRIEAIVIADEQMVTTKYMAYTTIVSGALTVPRKARSALKNYSVFRTVSRASATSKEITINVSWKHKGKIAKHGISSLVVSP
jgi:type IV pilus assembly protein PilV